MITRGKILKKLCASHHASEADSTHVSEKSCFRSRQEIHGPTFMSSFQLSIECEFLVDFPIDQFYFFKLRDIHSSSHSSMAMYDKRLGISLKY